MLAGVVSEKIDQLAAFQNFAILPLTMLGVFYSIHSLPAFWREVPRQSFFYMIDGFRYGFGASDVAPATSLAVVAAALAAVATACLCCSNPPS